MLAEEDINFIKAHLAEWLAEKSLGKPPVVYEIELRERMVRVEEALKNQGETMQMFMHQMERRCDQMDQKIDMLRTDMNQKIDLLRSDMEKRSNQMDQKIDLLRSDMEKRSNQMDQKIDLLRIDMEKRFEEIDKRFEQVDKRFELVDKRFDQVDESFKQIRQEILQIHRDMRQFTMWALGIFLSVAGLSVAILKFL